ncbi:DENN/MADD domain containing 2Da isoform X3 [Channa argus]|uniref:DENN/MADD domain containing 2Da isoform X3 n=1 Tax=Channa argus TaxID=215402 RepID=UPI0035220D8C
MDKTQQVTLEQPRPPSARRSFSFSSLRIKKRHSSDEGSGFTRPRGLLSFSSVREKSRNVRDEDDVPPLSSVQDKLKKTGEQPKVSSNLISDVSANHNAIPGADEGGRQGPFKRFSTMCSGMRIGKKEKPKQPELAETICPTAEDNASRQQRYASGQYFFEYLVVVSLKKTKDGNYEPQITYQFPKRDGMVKYQKEEEEKTLKAITLFCFPEGVNWAPLTEYHSETFSFVLTEIDGSRRNGYCRRLLPGGKGARPPEAYCIISSVASFGLFSKIIRLTRPLDSRLEHVNFASLFNCLEVEDLLKVFAAAVLERRIVFVADELSTLSQVIHAVAALLYPFTWQHTLIPIVPEILIDVVMAPTPYLLGVQKRLLDQVTDHTDLLMVDFCDGKKKPFIAELGDESSILPPKLRNELQAELQALKTRKDSMMVEEQNRIVSDAFLEFFVNIVGHYKSHVKRSRTGETAVFEKRNFYKAIEPKATRHFVKTFMQTQMFDLFIQEVEQHPDGPQLGIFDKKILEYQEKKKREKAKKH